MSSEYSFTDREKQMLFMSLYRTRQELTAYRSWLETVDRQPLPGLAIAVEEMKNEINDYVDLQVKLQKMGWNK